MGEKLIDAKVHFLNRIYNLIDGPRKKYGDFKKCEFHIHTPASKCYRFIYHGDESEDLEGKYKYETLTLEEVIDYSKECGYLTDTMYNSINENLAEYKGDVYKEILKEKNIPFDSFKEYITYMTIAHKLYQERIEVAIISDHNTIKGYEKLKFALNQYHQERCNKETTRVELFLGVEISCSDKNHLIIIYDSYKSKSLQKYLNEIIMDEELGTYFDTRKIIEDMTKHNAITYIAHINSSNLYGSGIYNKTLFNSKGLIGVGITSIEKIEREKNRIRYHRKNVDNIAIVYEGDSHAIESIGKKNCWIKLSKITYNALVKAFLNHQICMYNDKPLKTPIYIKGIVVETGEYGFLGVSPKLKNIKPSDRNLVIDFSSDLNCIIGGKGTGKSTVLNVIETIFSQQTDDLNMLNFISQHKKIYSLFYIDDKEYLLEFIPQTAFKGYDECPTLLKNSYYKTSTYFKLQPQWYNLYLVITLNKEKKIYEKINEKDVSYILKNVFRRGYNINKLVNKVSNNDIGEYIKEVVTYGVNYQDINGYIREMKSKSDYHFQKYLKDNLSSIISVIEDRKKLFVNITSEFNAKNNNILKIEHTSINKFEEYIEPFIDIFEVEENKYGSNKYVLNTYLTWGDVQQYFIQLIKKVNYFQVLDMFLNKRFNVMNKYLDITSFQSSQVTFKGVNSGLVSIDSSNKGQVYKEIFERVKRNRTLLEQSIIKCFKVLDKFDIKFNVNSKEDVATVSNNFKDIKCLSLGQKVAALLTFVFKFGIIAGDNTPLLIDQPEDNLDNTYIYKTLVESLKSVKNSRQVIIVTHSSTIVTNADAEEVIVMNSDSTRGWIEKSGYPSEEVITKHIINYLEGGEESFRHKMKMYNTIIGN